MDDISYILEELLYYYFGIYDIAYLVEAYMSALIGASVGSLLLYVLGSFFRMKMGEKANLGNGWQAWIPFAQELYLVKLAKVKTWKIIFFGVYFSLICSVAALAATLLFAADMENLIYYGEGGFATVLAIILLLLIGIFAIWAVVEQIRTYISLYKNFTNTGSIYSVAAVCGVLFGMPILIIIADGIVAFSDSHEYIQDNEVPVVPNYNPSGKTATISGVSGVYAGQSFDIEDGMEIVFGRDPVSCNVIFPNSETAVSRKHCSVKYIGMSDTFLVSVYSKNGVLCGGQKIEAGSSRILNKGNFIALGTEANKFILG